MIVRRSVFRSSTSRFARTVRKASASGPEGARSIASGIRLFRLNVDSGMRPRSGSCNASETSPLQRVRVSNASATPAAETPSRSPSSPARTAFLTGRGCTRAASSAALRSTAFCVPRAPNVRSCSRLSKRLSYSRESRSPEALSCPRRLSTPRSARVRAADSTSLRYLVNSTPYAVARVRRVRHRSGDAELQDVRVRGRNDARIVEKRLGRVSLQPVLTDHALCDLRHARDLELGLGDPVGILVDLRAR